MASSRKTPLLVVSMGDPAGIGPEVILKAAAALATKPDAPATVVIGDLGVMREAARRLGAKVPAPYSWNRRTRPPKLADALAVANLSALEASATEPGRPTIAGADAAYRYIVEGARMALSGKADALVTAPINKEWLNRAGHHFPGHSELLAKLSHARLWRMMFAGEELRLALVTAHLGLARVSAELSREGVFQTIRLLAEHLQRQLGVVRPRITVLGFNPHAGENGLFGDEEGKVIIPAVRRAQREGIDAAGPVAPDTAFIRTNGHFDFDGAVAMYHDQGLIALKTLEFDRAVNITLGLPFVRTSPDHGTAYDIAGRGAASGASMCAALEYAARAARARLVSAEAGCVTGLAG